MKRWFILGIAMLVLAGGVANAQQSASSGIIGDVRDSTRAGVPGATVTIINTGTNAQRVVTTDADGRFNVPNLPAATYDVRIELAGFRTVELKDFTIRQGEIVRPAVNLDVASLSETVSVTGEAPLLQTASATVGATINQKMLEELPVVGRTLLNITTSAPGVSARSFQQGTQYGRRDQFVTVEGGRDSSTNYAIDGVYVRSLRFNNMSLNPPIDAVQEVSVLRNSFSTEYGQGSAVVSMVTKSGTNRFSGTASEYFRNDALNAKNYFAAAKPQQERNQYGFASGGPIWRNKAFFFGGTRGRAKRRARRKSQRRSPIQTG
jgi:hypothetical protein